MTIREALQFGITTLKKAGIDSASLDAEVLLLHAMGGERDRAWLYGHAAEQHVSRTAEQHFKTLVRRRARHEPVAYIVGHKEFYGLDFLVNRNTLIPRPETETLVEEAIQEAVRCQMLSVKCVIADVGTGSGAIAIAVAKELRIKNEELRIYGTDISANALAVAKKNAKRHGVETQITFLRGNLLEPVLKRSAGLYVPPSGTRGATLRDAKASHYIILANLPYLPTSEWRATMPDVKKFEPRGALDGGKDGLKYYRELFQQLKNFLSSRGTNGVGDAAISHHGRRLPRPDRKASGLAMTVLAEICPEQTVSLKKLVHAYFPTATCTVIKDLSGKNRVVVVKLN